MKKSSKGEPNTIYEITSEIDHFIDAILENKEARKL
jgi:predicted transcriptional regulator